MNSPICYKVIYTKSLDNANEVVAESWECKTKDLAINLFNERVNKLMKEILDNEYYQAKISIHKHKALIRLESTHHCLAIVDDMNKSIL